MNNNYNLKNPVHFLALGFGSGLLKPAPGTWGTLMALPVYMFGLSLLRWEYYLAVLVLTALAGIYICGKAASDVGKHDDGAIVWDEFVGMWITMFMMPNHWIWLLVGFALFRFFDIIKPFPIGWLDKKVKGGFGIMLDDIIAGLMALACMHGLAWAYVHVYLGLPVDN